MKRKKELTSFQMIREMVKFYFQIKARRDRIYRKPKRVSGAIQKAFRDHSRQILVENPKAVLSAAGEFVVGKQHSSVVSKHFKNYAIDYSPSKQPSFRKAVFLKRSLDSIKLEIHAKLKSVGTQDIPEIIRSFKWYNKDRQITKELTNYEYYEAQLKVVSEYIEGNRYDQYVEHFVKRT